MEKSGRRLHNTAVREFCVERSDLRDRSVFSGTGVPARRAHRRRKLHNTDRNCLADTNKYRFVNTDGYSDSYRYCNKFSNEYTDEYGDSNSNCNVVWQNRI